MPTKRSRVLADTPLKSVMIKEPTQVHFVLHDSTIESEDTGEGTWDGNSSDDRDFVDRTTSPDSKTSLVNLEDEELQEFRRTMVTFDEKVIKAATCFKSKTQMEEYKARGKKRFTTSWVIHLIHWMLWE